MSETELCTCGHERKYHDHTESPELFFLESSCAALVDSLHTCDCEQFIPRHPAPDAAEGQAVDGRTELERQHAATDALWNENTELRARVTELENQNRRTASWYSAEQDITEELQTQLAELRAKLAAAEEMADTSTRLAIQRGQLAQVLQEQLTASEAALQAEKEISNARKQVTDNLMAELDNAHDSASNAHQWAADCKRRAEESEAARDAAISLSDEWQNRTAVAESALERLQKQYKSAMGIPFYYESKSSIVTDSQGRNVRRTESGDENDPTREIKP